MCFAVRLPLAGQQTFQLEAFVFLENPGVRQNEPAIGERKDGAGEERALSPLENLSQRLQTNHESHLEIDS